MAQGKVFIKESVVCMCSSSFAMPVRCATTPCYSEKDQLQGWTCLSAAPAHILWREDSLWQCVACLSCSRHLLGQVVNKVRGQLGKLERKTLSALIVIDVHARDVTAELARQGVASETDFEWISQLRCVNSSLAKHSALSVCTGSLLMRAGGLRRQQ